MQIIRSALSLLLALGLAGAAPASAMDDSCESALLQALKREVRLSARDFERTLQENGIPKWDASPAADNPAHVLASGWKLLKMKDATIGGHPIERVNRQGDSNEGVFFYRHNDGSHRAVKVLPISATDAERELNRIFSNPTVSIRPQLDLSLAFEEIHGAYLAEKLGGAKVYGYGATTIERPDGSNSRRVYIEMEELFPHQRAYTMKSLAFGILPELAFRPHGERIAREMAKKLIEAAEAGVVPLDPDFMITEAGAVRWLDSGLWYRERAPEKLMTGPFSLLLDAFFHGLDSVTISAAAARTGRAFVDGLLSQLKRAQAFTDSHKESFIRHTFARQPAKSPELEVFRAKKVQLLRNLGYLPSNETDSVNPAEVMLEYFRKLKR